MFSVKVDKKASYKYLREVAVEGQVPSYKPGLIFLFGMLSLLDVMLDILCIHQRMRGSAD
jgi:hypothetical protein